MRKVLYLLLFVCLAGCQPEASTISYCYKNSQSCILMEASRAGSLEDFQVNMTITNDFSRYSEESASLELPMSSFTENEIEISWESERKCSFSFLLRDGTKRNYLLKMEENRFHLRQI